MFSPTNIPYEVGTFSTAAANGTPTLASQGQETQLARYVNVWYKLTGGTSVTTRIWLYRDVIGWILYTDIPTTTILTANGGGILQIETRGAQRVYVELITFVGPPTVNVRVDVVTY